MPWTLLAGGTFKGFSEANFVATCGDPLARFFLSGDRHRHPPFQWATREPAVTHLRALMNAGNLRLKGDGGN